MKTVMKMVLIIALSLSMGCVSMTTATSKDVQSVTKKNLRSMMGNPDVIILDVRPEQQWKASDLKIRGAVHENPTKVESWAKKYSKDKTLIFYCA